MGKHKGMFQIGNPGGPGRPKRQTEADYLLATMESVPLDTWRAIVARAVNDAQDGDYRAREWLGRYLIGDPATKAPAPLQVVVQQLLQQDQALTLAASELARPEVMKSGGRWLLDEQDILQAKALEADAAVAIVAAAQMMEKP